MTNKDKATPLPTLYTLLFPDSISLLHSQLLFSPSTPSSAGGVGSTGVTVSP